MNAPGLQHPLVTSAQYGRQRIHPLRRFLHQQQVRMLVSHQMDDVVERRADEAKQVPTDDLDQGYLPGVVVVAPEACGAVVPSVRGAG
jgi:hypothetical protein